MLKSIMQEIIKSLIVNYCIPRRYSLLEQTTKQTANH